MKSGSHVGLPFFMRIFLFLVLSFALTLIGVSGSFGEETVILLTLGQENETQQHAESGSVVLTLPREVYGFEQNILYVDVWEDGILDLTVYGEDGTCRYRMSAEASKGRNELSWNGTGSYDQPLAKGTYSVEVQFQGKDGKIGEAQDSTVLAGNRQALLYALPSSDVLYLNDSGTWMVECALSQNGTVVMDILSDDDTNTLLARVTQNARKLSAVRLVWNGRSSTSRFVPVGTYKVSVYPQGEPEQAAVMRLFVQDSDKESYSLGTTGPIVPQRGMTDREIWNMMMQPSVVYDGQEAAYVRAQPSMRSAKAGKINPQKQALEVVSIEGDWTRVRAWGQDGGETIEGYLQTAHLKVVLPNRQYGILVDLRTQTMDVYEYGRKIGRIPVSSGLGTASQPNWTTPAGSYFTGYHLDAATSAGKTYECRIVYDGNRLIEQAGYEIRRGVISYSESENLGKEATRGNIAVPVSAGEELNAWWLYSHLPSGTRIIILDKEDSAPAGVFSETEDKTESVDQEIVLTVCGDAEIGMSEYSPGDGSADMTVFDGMLDLFRSDDLTLVSLASVLNDDTEYVGSVRHGALRAPTRYSEYFSSAGIDAVSLVSSHFSDYRYQGRLTTIEALEKAGVKTTGAGSVLVYEKNGHRIGIIADRERSFGENPDLITQDIARLRRDGCEAVIALCAWGTEDSGWHTEVQEKMAMHLIASGADLVIGQGSGVQGIETFNGVPIVWNLGKIVDRQEHPISLYSLVARISLHFSDRGYEGAELSLLPYAISSQAEEGTNDFHPVPAQPYPADILLGIAQKLSKCRIQETMWFPASPVRAD